MLHAHPKRSPNTRQGIGETNINRRQIQFGLLFKSNLTHYLLATSFLTFPPIPSTNLISIFLLQIPQSKSIITFYDYERWGSPGVHFASSWSAPSHKPVFQKMFTQMWCSGTTWTPTTSSLPTMCWLRATVKKYTNQDSDTSLTLSQLSERFLPSFWSHIKFVQVTIIIWPNLHGRKLVYSSLIHHWLTFHLREKQQQRYFWEGHEVSSSMPRRFRCMSSIWANCSDVWSEKTEFHSQCSKVKSFHRSSLSLPAENRW